MSRAHRGLCAQSDALYAFDAAWLAERSGPLAGADEAGRGALAGPLLAAAVVLGEDEIRGINDSKTLRAGLREELYEEVLETAGALCIASFPAWWIDHHGVGTANRESLRPYAGCGLADGNLKLMPEIECLPRADGKSATVAAASVVAKVLRDGAMRVLADEYPRYGFERNRGYGTV